MKKKRKKRKKRKKKKCLSLRIVQLRYLCFNRKIGKGVGKWILES